MKTVSLTMGREKAKHRIQESLAQPTSILVAVRPGPTALMASRLKTLITTMTMAMSAARINMTGAEGLTALRSVARLVP